MTDTKQKPDGWVVECDEGVMLSSFDSSRRRSLDIVRCTFSILHGKTDSAIVAEGFHPRPVKLVFLDEEEK